MTTDFPRSQRLANPIARGLHSSRQLHENVASEASTSLMLSVQRTLEGTQSTFFRPTLRLKMCVSSKRSFASWQQQLDDRPADRAEAGNRNFQFLLADWRLLRREQACFRDLDFEGFDFAANASPQCRLGTYTAFPKPARIIRYFRFRPGRNVDEMAAALRLPRRNRSESKSTSHGPNRTSG